MINDLIHFKILQEMAISEVKIATAIINKTFRIEDVVEVVFGSAAKVSFTHRCTSN